jgi:integral membrane protein (TIGR01906 family)
MTQIVCLALLWRSSQRCLLPAHLRQGVWLTAALIGLVAVSSLIDFGLFFTRFHQVFFPPGTWTFDPMDTLIQLYPLPFWVDAVYKIAAVTCFEIVLVYVLSLALERSPWLRNA